MYYSQITPEVLRDKKFTQVSDGSWKKNIWGNVFIYLKLESRKWKVKFVLEDTCSGQTLDSRIWEFDGSMFQLNYLCLQLTGGEIRV